MKKIFTIVSLMAVAVAFTSCGNSTTKTTDQVDSTVVVAPVVDSVAVAADSTVVATPEILVK